MVRFVIVFPGRCGSNMLTRMLKLHPQIDLSAHEAFAEEPLARGDRRPIGDDEHGAAYVDRVVYVAEHPDIEAVGFKLAYQHASRPPQSTVWEFVGARDVKVIHLTRLNPLDRLISFELAASQQRWDANDQRDGVYDPVPVRIDFADLRAQVAWLASSAARVRASVPEARRLELHYEELAREPGQVLARCLSFIGVAPRPILPVTKRQRTFGQRTAVANYDELRDTVRRRRPEWSAFFTDA